MLDLEAIRTRNEEQYLGHRYCEDTFYACPAHEDYCGLEARGEKNCDCGLAERVQQKADVDALLDEILSLEVLIASLFSRQHEIREVRSAGRLIAPKDRPRYGKVVFEGASRD
jgi:hypothetical protein